MEYKRHLEIESDTEEDSDYETSLRKRKISLLTSNYHEESQRKRPRCFSKNALMARENRMRKKMYVEGLERNVAKLTQENRKLQSKVENQAQTIEKLLKEVKYVKSVLANSTDISKILRSIHHNTGMLVGTSLDKSLSFTSNYVSNKQPDSFISTAEDLLNSQNDDLGVLFNDPELLNLEETNNFNTFEEHNYTSPTDDVDDVGVCLHVSKHKVSLEFCSKCSEDAAAVWKDNL